MLTMHEGRRPERAPVRKSGRARATAPARTRLFLENLVQLAETTLLGTAMLAGLAAVTLLLIRVLAQGGSP